MKFVRIMTMVLAMVAAGCTVFHVPVVRSAENLAAHVQASSPTALPSPTSGPITPTPIAYTASVTPSSTSVEVGQTITVTANSNLGIPLYRLTVIDLSTGSAQSTSDPLLTPAQPGPLSPNGFGSVTWTLQAIRAGSVRFSVGVSGEVFNNTCGCWTWGSASASSSVVAITAPTATLTPTPTITPSPTPSPICSVRYNHTSWNTGFTADIALTNTSNSAISGWNLTWSFGGNQQIINAWNTTITQNGGTISAANMPYNAAIGTGASVYLGFLGTYSGTNNKPTSFALNGSPCLIVQ